MADLTHPTEAVEAVARALQSEGASGTDFQRHDYRRRAIALLDQMAPILTAAAVEAERAKWAVQTALLRLGDLEAQEPCCACGSVIATRGELHLADGRWVCSEQCNSALRAQSGSTGGGTLSRIIGREGVEI